MHLAIISILVRGVIPPLHQGIFVHWLKLCIQPLWGAKVFGVYDIDYQDGICVIL